MKSLLALAATVSTSAAIAGGAAPNVVAAPTLGEIGLVALAVIVGVAGALVVRRRK